MNLPVIIRPATLDDALAIAEVHVISWRQAYRGLMPATFLEGLSVEEREALWSDSITKNEPEILVVERDGAVAGFCAFGPCRDPGSMPSDYEIWAMYLHPAHWSRGLGRELWLASHNRIVEHGAKTVSLWVLADNERAIRFYHAMGFEAETGSGKFLERGSVQLQEVRFTQQLSGGANHAEG